MVEVLWRPGKKAVLAFEANIHRLFLSLAGLFQKEPRRFPWVLRLYHRPTWVRRFKACLRGEEAADEEELRIAMGSSTLVNRPWVW